VATKFTSGESRGSAALGVPLRRSRRPVPTPRASPVPVPPAVLGAAGGGQARARAGSGSRPAPAPETHGQGSQQPGTSSRRGGPSHRPSAARARASASVKRPRRVPWRKRCCCSWRGFGYPVAMGNSAARNAEAGIKGSYGLETAPPSEPPAPPPSRDLCVDVAGGRRRHRGTQYGLETGQAGARGGRTGGRTARRRGHRSHDGEADRPVHARLRPSPPHPRPRGHTTVRALAERRDQDNDSVPLAAPLPPAAATPTWPSARRLGAPFTATRTVSATRSRPAEPTSAASWPSTVRNRNGNARATAPAPPRTDRSFRAPPYGRWRNAASERHGVSLPFSMGTRCPPHREPDAERS
jgi:hypothetical protein